MDKEKIISEAYKEWISAGGVTDKSLFNGIGKTVLSMAEYLSIKENGQLAIYSDTDEEDNTIFRIIKILYVNNGFTYGVDVTTNNEVAVKNELVKRFSYI